MNMNNSMNGMLHITALDVIVGLAVLFPMAFLAAWLSSPRLRQRLERPKFGFQADLESYYRVQRGSSTLKGGEATK